MKKSNIFWGIFFVFCAVFIIVNKLGFMEEINVVTMILTVLLAIVFVKSSCKVNFFGMLFSLAVLAILYDKQLNIEELTPWTVLGAALLGSIGLQLLFSRAKRNRKIKQHKRYMNEQGYSGNTDNIINEKRIYIESSFGSSIKYVDSDCFEYGEVVCSFSGVKIYFDNTVMAKGSATLHLDAAFSGVEIYIPRNWQVADLTKASFVGKDIIEGSETESGEGDRKSILNITGEVRFCSLTVKYL